MDKEPITEEEIKEEIEKIHAVLTDLLTPKSEREAQVFLCALTNAVARIIGSVSENYDQARENGDRIKTLVIATALALGKEI